MMGRHNNFKEQKELTKSEEKIMQFAINGLTNQEIAERLSLSVLTIEKHLTNIYYKYKICGLCLRTRAVLRYLKEKGLLCNIN